MTLGTCPLSNFCSSRPTRLDDCNAKGVILAAGALSSAGIKVCLFVVQYHCTTNCTHMLTEMLTVTSFWNTPTPFIDTLTTPDQSRSNRQSQLSEFKDESTPKMDSNYLRGSALEPFLFTIDALKIQGGNPFILFFMTLHTGSRRSLSQELSDTLHQLI